MSGTVVVTPEAIDRFGDAHAAMSAQLVGAGAVDQVAVMASAVPVFGLIGQDFLGSLAYTLTNHVTSIGELAAVHAGASSAAHRSAANYRTSEEDSSSALGAI
ncbi:type VII secretion target [Nocardia alni]|uniref:type VII secretion target n=1 Tax=Nocardia alni TaxID=2815723 RepID=UPI001C2372BD|nr:type VII secretion target [Nocardia alni]